MHDLAVVGAGPAGIAIAYFLRDLKLDVTILEAGEEVGGRTRSVPAESRQTREQPRPSHSFRNRSAGCISPETTHPRPPARTVPTTKLGALPTSSETPIPSGGEL